MMPTFTIKAKKNAGVTFKCTDSYCKKIKSLTLQEMRGMDSLPFCDCGCPMVAHSAKV